MSFFRAMLATWRAVLADPGAVLLLLGACVAYSFFYPQPYERCLLYTSDAADD